MVNLQPATTGTQLGLQLNAASSASATLSSQSFMQALSDAIAGTLEKFGIDPGSVSLNLGAKASQNNAVARQVSAAVAPSTPVDTRVGFNALVPLDSVQPHAIPVTAPPVQHFYVNDPVDDAYWNGQPAAVQQLREIDDYSQRQALGSQLASQGYQIDVPVMIWGWDAGKTMALRQSFGYTWVPSALQQPVAVAPGLSAVGSLAAYDPNNPPAGSIKV
ncbi:MAG: hypothetical protein ACR2NN_00705 [Bryobacteraceae bacterium]